MWIVTDGSRIVRTDGSRLSVQHGRVKTFHGRAEAEHYARIATRQLRATFRAAPLSTLDKGGS